MVSTSFIEAAFAQNTDEIFLMLATIDGDADGLPLRLVRNTVSVTSRANTYSPFPFDVTVPDSSSDSPPVAKFSISGITQEVIQALRLVSSPLTVTIEVIRAADPGTVEVAWPTFQLRNVKWSASTVEGDLTLDNPLNEPSQSLVFSPGFAPGVFAAQP